MEERLLEIQHTIRWTKKILAWRYELLAKSDTEMSKKYYQTLVSDCNRDLSRQQQMAVNLQGVLDYRRIREIANRRVIKVSDSPRDTKVCLDECKEYLRTNYMYSYRSPLRILVSGFTLMVDLHRWTWLGYTDSSITIDDPSRPLIEV